jgi:Ca-activated chloride channel family protein
LAVRQSRLEQQAIKSERTAGLAAVSPREVTFDLRTMWAQRGLIGGITSLIAPSGSPQPPGTPAQSLPFAYPTEPRNGARFSTEGYDFISDNPFVAVSVDPRSTFSIDVDTASYANVRRFIMQGERPPKDSVRIEEMINYFTYDYPAPSGTQPIAVVTEVASAPWQPAYRLVRIGIKAQEIDWSKRPASNLVFLIDVSGSMDHPFKLPLLESPSHRRNEKRRR